MANHRFPARYLVPGFARADAGFKERHKRRGLCWTQIVSIGRHIAAPLNYLSDEFGHA